MHQRGRRFRLGLYVLGSGGLFVLLCAFILQGSLGGDRASYFILFTENVKGMVVGSKVNFQGVPIGVVKDMRFQDGKTLVELRVDPTRANIQDVTRARMDRLLVTGQVTVELEGYAAAGKSLSPGAFIQPKEDPLHALTASLPEVVDRAADVLGRIDSMLVRAETLLGDENQQRVAAILAHAESAARQLAEDTMPQTTVLLREATATTGSIRQLAPDAASTLRETSALAAGLRGPLQTALASLRSTLDDLRGLARQLKLAPDSLLFGVQQPAAPAGGGR
jgi:phospholipid/cholesterol/gamma-HCH transport system substrate-binding protein